MKKSSNEVIHNGKTYRWVEDKSVCRGCQVKDKCEEICRKVAGYMKPVDND